MPDEEIWGRTVIPARQRPRMEQDFEDRQDREREARVNRFVKLAGGASPAESNTRMSDARSRLIMARQSRF